MTQDLTIVTVARTEHVPYVIANVLLQRRLCNGSRKVRWCIVDNEDGAVGEAIEAVGLRGVDVIQGPSAGPLGFGGGSYQHAAALNLVVPQVQSAFLLVLDPDLYIIRSQWVDDVLDWMHGEKVSVFGVPWHPVWYGKYRHFPSVHCLFVNIARISPDRLDFTPQLRERPTRRLPDEVKSSGVLLRDRPIIRWLAVPLRMAYHLTLMRRHIGKTRDTGYRLHERFSGRDDVLSTITSVVAPRSDFRWPFHLRTRLGWFLERILPEDWSYVPRGYLDPMPFVLRGSIDARRMGWEEFTWRDEPFAFHVRRMKQQNSPAKMPEQEQLDVLCSELATVSPPSPV